MYWEVIQYKNTGKETQNEQIMNTEGNMRSLRHCVVHKLQQEEAPAEPGKKKWQPLRLSQNTEIRLEKKWFFSIYSLKWMTINELKKVT